MQQRAVVSEPSSAAARTPRLLLHLLLLARYNELTCQLNFPLWKKRARAKLIAERHRRCRY
ncbi:unnamed protein product [Ascophyllum nodosum]